MGNRFIGIAIGRISLCFLSGLLSGSFRFVPPRPRTTDHRIHAGVYLVARVHAIFPGAGPRIGNGVLSDICFAQPLTGVSADPLRRAIREDRLEGEILPAFAARILPFDLDASQAYAGLMARARAGGKAIGKADGYIAANVTARGFIVATRDVAPFQAAGLSVINPWDARQ